MSRRGTVAAVSGWAVAATLAAVLVGPDQGFDPLWQRVSPDGARTGVLMMQGHRPAPMTTRQAIDAQPDLSARGRRCVEDMACWDALAMGNGTAGRGPVRMG